MVVPRVGAGRGAVPRKPTHFSTKPAEATDTTALRLNPCRRGLFLETLNITSKEGSSWDVALNQAAVEALYSAAYIEDYLDCVENLPDDVQRNLSQLRELDVKYQEVLAELEQQQGLLRRRDLDGSRKKVMLQIQHSLIKSQELGDDKLQLLQQIQDMIENKARQLDQDYRNLDHEPETREAKRSRRQRGHDDDQPPSAHPACNRRQPKKKRRRGGSNAGGTTHQQHHHQQAHQQGHQQGNQQRGIPSPAEPPIDPDEPTYCLCEQVSFGEMICCDNEECAIEWFHFSCVALTTKPKGRWYCPRCRGDRSNQMKPKGS
ncbi:putative inhibitor of growth protein [Ixodes scapularis]|uniref:Inhibitor of growth protein n=1 Tax=Ixodes scapularis TaxID=6945 RepID=B7PRC2_IXOSC|nr:inhibitor of growth protein, putative [Ixodes scapularis]|eukprot:XP_002399429.1 inhibitor of growth protein, putative [Ixodes scapularis]